MLIGASLSKPTLVRICNRPCDANKNDKNGKPHTSESLQSTTCNATKSDKNKGEHMQHNRNGTLQMYDHNLHTMIHVTISQQ